MQLGNGEIGLTEGKQESRKAGRRGILKSCLIDAIGQEKSAMRNKKLKLQIRNFEHTQSLLMVSAMALICFSISGETASVNKACIS